MGSCWDFGGPAWPFNVVLLGLLVSLWFFAAWRYFEKEASGEIELIASGQQTALLVLLGLAGIAVLVVDGSVWPVLAVLFGWLLNRGVGLLAHRERTARATRLLLLLVAVSAALVAAGAAAVMIASGPAC